MTLIRCPQGRAKKCFFQKHDSGTLGEHVKHVPIKEKDGRRCRIISISTTSAGCWPACRWGRSNSTAGAARSTSVEYPDRLVFDLDPDVGLDFGKVKAAAVRLRDLLADLGLEDLPVAVRRQGHPRRRAARRFERDWPTVKSFADRFSRAIAEAEPEMFTANIRKVQRKGRIFLDWLRNQRGATAVMPYSARAREGAPGRRADRMGRARQVQGRQSLHDPRRRQADRARQLEGARRLGQGRSRPCRRLILPRFNPSS